MTCKHAIIPVAGYGTRRLPITKTIEKEMLPILNRPVVDYIVEDCVKAGIEHIIFVVSEDSTQLQHYYGRDPHFEEYLKKKGKDDYIKMITPPENIQFDFVVQPRNAPFYGTTVPIALARPLIPKGESTLVLMGDDIVYDVDGGNAIKTLLDESQGEAAAMAAVVDKSEAPHYGVIISDENGNLDHMLEKPAVDELPSENDTVNINISKFVFTSELLDETVKFYEEPYPEDKEKYVNIQPLDRYLATGRIMKVVPIAGAYLDVGTLEKWLYANNYVAKHLGIL